MIPLSSLLVRQSLFLILLGMGLLGPVASLQAGSMVRLEAAVQQAVAILRDPALAAPEHTQARRDTLREAIYSEFDFNAISQGAVGHKWRKFSEAQRTRFIPLFRRLLENAYMDTIERYKDSEVRFVKEVAQSDTVIRVDSLVASKGVEFQVSYQLRKAPDQTWKVFDVIIEGVSVVSNYRSQFKQMLRRGTPAEIDELLTRLEGMSQ